MRGAPISGGFRLALALKAALLVSLGAVLEGVAIGALVHDAWPLLARLLVAAFFGALGLFPAAQSRFALLDAVLGTSVEVTGAVALLSRKSGLSFRLPDGRYAEFVLWNTWEPLQPGEAYRLVLGQRSRTIVARPVREASAAG